MCSIFDILPGLQMPVSEVTKTLAWMWEPDFNGKDQPVEYRASQMNLILHLGLKTPPEEALKQFHIAVAFAQRYPCRIIVLCPDPTPEGDYLLEGKLFAQCYIGENQRELCYCEALILGYPPGEGGYLENQVSIWLESDLPTYYWIHRVDPKRVKEMYLSFAQFCQRIVYDSSVDPEYVNIPWPDKENTVRDIAFSRLLTIRQPMGQFLSTYPPACLVENLESVLIEYNPEKCGEAKQLLAWMQDNLNACADQSGKVLEAAFQTRPEKGRCFLDIHWKYRGPKHFQWIYNGDHCHPKLSADFNRGPVDYPLQVRTLKPEDVLGEALFF